MIPFANGTFRIDIDDCESDPCQDRGTCVDKLDDYNCTCKPAWKGKNCDVRS